MRKGFNQYPDDWEDLARRIKIDAEWVCERCRHKHDPGSGHTLTVHHLDMDKSNCATWNLAALCQRCHLSIQHKVVWEQGYLFEHSEWMKPHFEAWQKEQFGTTDLYLKGR